MNDRLFSDPVLGRADAEGAQSYDDGKGLVACPYGSLPLSKRAQRKVQQGRMTLDPRAVAWQPG